MHDNLLALLLLLTAAVIAVALAHRFRLPAILAYLAIGIGLGPHGMAVLAESEQVATFAEFGVVFLMFSIGLEFSLQRLKTMRSLVFGFGSAQMALTVAGAMFIAWLGYGQGWRAGLAVGLAVAMSSTAIVAKLLSERFELHSRSGRQTMGVLLFQDLAVVPCLLLLPALANPGEDLVRAMWLAAVQAAVVLGVLIWAGQHLMRRLYDAVAARRSEELFVLATLWVVIGLAYATGAAGLSLALGAFVGGMLISETMYRHQVEADIRPFRDILLGLFFVTIGMMLDLGYVFGNLDGLLLAVLLLVGGKGVVVLLVAFSARNSPDVALRTAAQLAQAGEFGLVLTGLAHRLGLVGDDVFQVTLSAMLVSMFLAPFLIERVARLSGQMAKGDWAHKAASIHEVAVAGFGLEQHVIVCGYGRTGSRIAEFLARENIPFLALDYPDIPSAERVLRLVRGQRPDVPVIIRAPDDSHMRQLKEAGATEVIPEVLEGSLMIAAETLAQLGIPVERAMTHVREARAERYASLRDYYRKTP